ncbi:uncharacterized protein LOC125657494 isoform X7 [Ostrea edulis]|uniref:uncharacterized protein LOC125657494 isoform X7 n=1 Tax=Ostrea edulis TaxID=37623 RepID=UPI0024AF76C1|nr:uncharacterized protein LOC125657494 isoform X7 [Ostrea edulis]
MDYSERFKRYSRTDSKDSRSKLRSKESRNGSLTMKPSSNESNDEAVIYGGQTSRRVSGELKGRLREYNKKESGEVNGRQRGSSEFNRKSAEIYHSNKSSREGGELNSRGKASAENNSGKHTSKTKDRRRQTKEPQSQMEALVPVKTGRSSPGKLASPRKLGKGEIPHNHPDRSITEIRMQSNALRKFDIWQRPSIGVKIKGGSDDFGSYHFESRGFYDPSIYLYPTTDNVPRSYLEEKEMECLAKDETIRILNSKIRRLEHLIQLKDTRLLELQGQYSREQRLYYMAARNNILR